MLGRSPLSKRVDRLEAEVAGIRRLYEKTLDYSERDPETALMNARKAAEAVCSRVFEHKVGKQPKSMTLQPLIEKLTQLDALPEHILVSLRTIQGFGNLGVHHQPGEPAEITSQDAQPCLAALGTVVQWYFKEYGSPAADGSVDMTPRPRVGRHVFSGVAPARAVLFAATAAVATLLLAAVAAWNGCHSGPATISHVPPHVGKPRIAALPFQQLSDGPDVKGLQHGIGTVVTARLTQSGAFDVVERSRLDAVLAELELSQDAKFDHSQAARIGRLLGAKQLVLGSFFSFGDRLRLDARVIDTETGQVLYSVDAEGEPEKVDRITHSLCDALITEHPDQSRPTPHIIRSGSGRPVDARDEQPPDGRRRESEQTRSPHP